LITTIATKADQILKDIEKLSDVNYLGRLASINLAGFMI
jgi:hypothetical protein